MYLARLKEGLCLWKLCRILRISATLSLRLACSMTPATPARQGRYGAKYLLSSIFHHMVRYLNLLLHSTSHHTTIFIDDRSDVKNTHHKNCKRILEQKRFSNG